MKFNLFNKKRKLDDLDVGDTLYGIDLTNFENKNFKVNFKNINYIGISPFNNNNKYSFEYSENQRTFEVNIMKSKFILFITEDERTKYILSEL